MNRRAIKFNSLPEVDGRRLKSAFKALNSDKWEQSNWYENTDNATFNETKPRVWKNFFEDGRSIKYTWLIRLYEIWNNGCTMGYDLVFVPEFECLKESVQKDIRQMCGLYPEDRPCADDIEAYGAGIVVGGMEVKHDYPELDYIAMCALAIDEVEADIEQQVLWSSVTNCKRGIDLLNEVLK